MTNSGVRPEASRGERRRDQLVEAGVAVLAEGGWSALTTRAVAERAGANLGLIHYHFGGLPKLRLAIARRAGEMVIDPIVGEFLAARDERTALEAMRRMLPETTGDTRVTRLATELITEAFRDPALGDLTRQQLQEARDQIVERLAELRPDWSEQRRIGAATLLTGLLDGLMLHRLIDPELPVGAAFTALADLLGIESAPERRPGPPSRSL